MIRNVQSRVLLSLAVVVVLGHALISAFWGGTPLGTLLGNLVEILCSLLSAAFAFRASRRGSSFARSFWTLIACGMAIWGIANIGWAWSEFFHNSTPARNSLTRFLFDAHGMFFLMAIFLDQDKHSSNLNLSELLDFVQIGILFFLIYFGMYYLPSFNLELRSALVREITVVSLCYFGIVLLALAQWRRARTSQQRHLFGGLARYTAIYAVSGTAAEILQLLRSTPTGTLADLAWSLPLLYGAFWAAGFDPRAVSDSATLRPTKPLADIALTNGILILTPLVIVLQIASIGPGWRVLRYSLLAVSMLCYAVRIGLGQYRRQKDEETLRRQTLAMDTSADGIAILDHRGIHVYVNSAFLSMLGYDSSDRVLGMTWRDVYSLQDLTRLESDVRASILVSSKWSGTLPLRRPDGTDIPVELTVAAMPDGGTACVCRDLSLRAEAERARAEAETKYKLLVEHVNAISYIAEIGLHGQWFYVSPQVESILGYTPDEWLVLSPNWDSFIHPEDLPIVVAAEEDSRRGVPFQAEFRIRRKDGREIWLNDTAVIVQGSDSHPLMEGIIVDITERKQLEKQLQQSRKMEAVGRLAGGIAHDFNNLLTIITGYTDLALNRSSVPAEVRADIERIDNAAGRAAALVRQLLAFSRRQVMQPRTLDLNAIVLNLETLLRRLLGESVVISTNVQENLGKVKADPAQLEQVVMNLVVNARDAMPSGGEITLRTSNADLDNGYADEHFSVKPGKYVMLSVADTGVGMDRETQAHIFEPFYTTKESGRGTGLGLSTVYGIVKQSGGYIWVQSEPGRGSTFNVYLPRVKDAVEDPALSQPGQAQLGGTESVLLVEDEDAVRDLLQTVLAERGYEVIPARDPAHALDLVRQRAGRVHLLLTDVVMPGMSGRELASRVTSLYPSIRVLFMSGYSDNIITSGGMLEKGIAFLQKPFSPEQVARKIREVLSQAPAR